MIVELDVEASLDESDELRMPVVGTESRKIPGDVVEDERLFHCVVCDKVS